MFGDIKVEVLEKHFYCGCCEEYNSKCRRQHRSGIWFLLKVSKNGQLYITIGEGETRTLPKWLEYLNMYSSTSGWMSPAYMPIVHEESELPIDSMRKEVELTDFEKTVLYKLLLTNYVKQPESKNYYKTPIGLNLLIELLKSNIINLSDDLGALNIFKPLLYTWCNNDLIRLPDDAYIDKIGQSFLAEFKYGGITVNIPKKSRYYYDSRKIYLDCESDSYTKINIVEINENKKIYYARHGHRKTVYYKCYNRILGWEEYLSYRHPMCEIEIIEKDEMDFEHYMDFLFTRRLGDIIFLKDSTVEYYEWKLSYADKSAFDKVKVIHGSVELGDKIVVSGKRITLYHPEHGLLELPKGEYIAYEVPYIRRGHD